MNVIQELVSIQQTEIITIEKIANYRGISQQEAKRIADLLHDRLLLKLDGDVIALTEKGKTTITQL
ncbi:MAG: hypothetical protein EOP56_05520 [Sphingobacteriales bacterium]|nr:MAG: hypothetical protein EOP56_05520 [Sphingobacteriales bacterium]